MAFFRPLSEIAAQLGLTEADYEPYGRDAAKLEHGLLSRVGSRPRGKYIGVTAITPTSFGEGKTVTTIGLSMALNRRGKRAVATIRQPSLAPVFGLKGGGAGGGNSRLHPFEKINLHFTGDLHAVAAANNLLAAMVDNHVKRGLDPKFPGDAVTWRRVVDISDKALSEIEVGLGAYQLPRKTGFDLTAASEVMAILSLASDLKDLRRRLENIIVAIEPDGKTYRAGNVGATGAMAALLADAFRPNLAQTSEGTPALVHTGPFANIAHGNSSRLADEIALRLSEYVVTESGFGSDCGAEKFFDIKCRGTQLKPAAMVVVVTVRAMKWHSGQYGEKSGAALPELQKENVEATREGCANLVGHLNLLKQFGIPTVVALNRFPTDTTSEIDVVLKTARNAGAFRAVSSEIFTKGGEGGLDLADAVMAAAEIPSDLKFLYNLELPIAEKLNQIATKAYGARDIAMSPLALSKAKSFEEAGYGKLPLCVAKTAFSLSHDPKLLGRPKDFTVPIRDLRLCAGAEFIYALTGEISTLPGLPSVPAALKIDIDDNGKILNLS